MKSTDLAGSLNTEVFGMTMVPMFVMSGMKMVPIPAAVVTLLAMVMMPRNRSGPRMKKV